MSKTPVILSPLTVLHTTARASSRFQPERHIEDPVCSPHAFDVLDAVWNGLNVPAFKPPGISMLAVSGARVRLSDAVVDQFLDSNMTIMKGMVAERKFLLFNVNSFTAYSNDIDDNGSVDATDEHGTLGLIHTANGNLLIVGNCNNTTTRAAWTLSDRYTRDLSLARLLMLASGERLFRIDDDGEILGLSLFNIEEGEKG